MSRDRRSLLKLALAGAGAATAPLAGAAPCGRPGSALQPAYGTEGQRKADLGNGLFINPIVPGDHPDPTILKDGHDYYMTFSSFYSYPGAVIWHSRDLVNWAPICAALTRPIGSVWAMDLVKHGGRYFLYIPADDRIFVIHADNIRGPWSDPVDLRLQGCIDPGHAVGEDGKRYLFFNGVRRIALADDGLSTVGALEHVYHPWRYPENWVVEMFAPEGPKPFRRGEWFYLVAAVGGTSGPPTSHMVTVARSRSIHGPWQDCPGNPIVRTRSADEPWWSRGHASIVEGPGGDWWMIYHAYENGFRTLGRQAILEPIEWTGDGWFRARGGSLDKPLHKPKGGSASPAGQALSDDFSSNRFGVQWSFFAPGPEEMRRARYDGKGLVIKGKGSSPADCSPSPASSATAITKCRWCSILRKAGKAACCCTTASAATAASASAPPRCSPTTTAKSNAGCGRKSRRGPSTSGWRTAPISSPSTTPATAWPGPGIHGKWKCRASTTMCSAAS